MQLGLRLSSHNNGFRIFRRALVAVSALFAVGIAAVGMGSTELMYDVTDSASLASAAIPPAESHDHGRYLSMEVTAYCACKKCCGPNAQGLTASGKDVSYNAGKFVAADTAVLPFGTRLVIPGYHSRPVEVIDRGSAIKGNKLDVYFPSHEEALQWGRRTIQVRVIEQRSEKI